MKAYLITMQGCGPCKTALEALKKAQPRYAEAMDVVDKDDERVKGFGVISYPTMVVYDEVAEKIAVQITGADELTEEFWKKAFIITED